VGFRLRIAGAFGVEKAIVAAALMVLFAIGSGLAAWALAGGVTLLLATLCAIETTSGHRHPDRAEPRARALGSGAP
jgi:hypothetical protein